MSKHENPWIDVEGKGLPATIKLDPVIFKYISANAHILDVACATGKVSIELASHGFPVTSIDINHDALEMTAKAAIEYEIQMVPAFARATAIALPFADESFDVVIMQAFLTVVVSKEDRSRIVREACRVLKPGTYLYIADFGQTWHSDIYRERYLRDLPVTKEEGSFLAYDEQTGEIAYTAHHFTEKELVFLLVENGFEVEFFKRDTFVTRTGNQVNGFVIVGKKV
ncbi:class I SAM-dependent methyltransferase [Methanolobus sediminis]|uniref:Class I SAM-dependent methyltransferase n=1 Tax=Methanolobus sediminis TaxID=3072978 RepID=A0AA51UMG8_9EURY|nr:class I SAM-dependent methyltransferase [Methanolobus sediminis]WMW26029.1 class I SAM-dependent methyltransferase [Methanolobus sediminis]